MNQRIKDFLVEAKILTKGNTGTYAGQDHGSWIFVDVNLSDKLTNQLAKNIFNTQGVPDIIIGPAMSGALMVHGVARYFDTRDSEPPLCMFADKQAGDFSLRDCFLEYLCARSGEALSIAIIDGVVESGYTMQRMLSLMNEKLSEAGIANYKIKAYCLVDIISERRPEYVLPELYSLAQVEKTALSAAG